VHRWLMLALQTCAREKNTENFLRWLREQADTAPVRAGELAARAGTELYPWWNHVHGQARAIALGLGEALAPHLHEHYFLSEFRLPPDVRVSLPGVAESDFSLRGQIDLLLIETGAAPFDPAHGVFDHAPHWVIDFKTGSAKNLTEKKLENGIGLQAVLYALAVRALGSGPVAVSLHTFDAPLKKQVQIDQVLTHTALFQSLDRFSRMGIFGMRADASNEYGFAPGYPMATRGISAEILEAKWALVHGAALLGGESE